MIEGQENLPDLPDGWNWANFPELAANKANALKAGPFGSALKKSFYVPSGYKIYGQEQVIKGDPYYGDYYIDENKFNDLISCSVAPQDILISLVGTIGKVLILPEDIEPGIINPRLVKLSLDKRISLPEYIKLYVESETVRKYFSMVSHGGTMEILNLKILKALPIPTPPLNEQRRIVEKVEALTARSRRAREALAAIPELLDQFRQSVLAAAFRGDLTADWRAQNPDVEPAEALLERIRVERRKRWEEAELEKMRAKGKEPKNDTWKAKYKPLPSVDVDQLPRIHEGWCWMTPDELSKSIPNALTIGPFGSNLKVSDYQEEGVPLVFVREIRAEHFGDEKTKYVSSQKADELKSHSVKSGDLLITKMGDPPGDTAVYPLDRPLAIITADCIKWSPEPQLTSSEFLKYWLRSDIAKSFIFSETKGVAQQKLSLKRFRSIPLPVPSLPEQKEILLRVRANFQLLQNIEDTLQSLEQDSDQLDQSILAKAFRGELVPQDPTDEPAAVLLARIRAERDKLNAQHKSKKPATRRKKANP